MTGRRFSLALLGPIVIGAILLIAFGALILSSWFTRDLALRPLLQANEQATLTVAARTLFAPLEQGDLQTIQATVDGYLRGTSVVYVAVRDRNGQIVAWATAGWQPDEEEDRRLSLQALVQRDIVQRRAVFRRERRGCEPGCAEAGGFHECSAVHFIFVHCDILSMFRT